MKNAVKVDTTYKIKSKFKEPEQYKVVLYNDDYTTMEFVVEVLMIIFHKCMGDANRIMLDIHKKGREIVGVYTWDIANTKIKQVHTMAETREFPLMCCTEPCV